jgi:hypothetical protein
MMFFFDESMVLSHFLQERLPSLLDTVILVPC